MCTLFGTSPAAAIAAYIPSGSPFLVFEGGRVNQIPACVRALAAADSNYGGTVAVINSNPRACR